MQNLQPNSAPFGQPLNLVVVDFISIKCIYKFDSCDFILYVYYYWSFAQLLVYGKIGSRHTSFCLPLAVCVLFL